MAIVQALMRADLTKQVRSGNLAKISLSFVFFMAAGYFLRLVSLQVGFSESYPQGLGKTLFQDMTIVQAVLLMFLLLWGYPQFPRPSGPKIILGIPISILNTTRIILAQNITSLIVISLLTSLSLPFLIIPYLLGGVDGEGIIRIFLFFQVLGLVVIWLRSFFYNLAGSEIKSSAYSSFTLLLLMAIPAYFNLLASLNNHDAVTFITRMLSPWPDFIEPSQSLVSWSSIIGKLSFSISLIIVTRLTY